MQPDMVVLLMCGTLSTCGELHHEHQTEVQLYVLAVTKPPAFHR